MRLRDPKTDTSRLAWLLTLIWETGQGTEESREALDTLKTLRRMLHDSSTLDATEVLDFLIEGER